MRKIIVAGVAIFIGITTTRASLAQWTFETSKPTSSGDYAAENGVFASTSKASEHHAGTDTASYSNPAGAGSAESFSANHWSVGDYYQFTTSTLGYEGIQVSFEAVSSGTGPKNFNLAYSTDGISFSVFTSYSLLKNSSPAWSASLSASSAANYAFQFDLSSVTQLNHQAKIYLRLVDTSTTSANGKTVHSSGTSRVDDFTITGNVAAAGLKTGSIPEPAGIFSGALLGLPLLGSGIRSLRRRGQTRNSR